MAEYYDFVLVFIPVLLAGLSLALATVGFSTTTAVPFAALATIPVVGHAMFVRGPTEPTPGTGSQATVTSSPDTFQTAD